jgi:hypothetical protein
MSAVLERRKWRRLSEVVMGFVVLRTTYLV